MTGKDSEHINSVFIRGLSWFGASSIAVQLFSMVQLIILARLLSPLDFGLFSILSIFITLAQEVNLDPWQTTIIQRKELDRDHLDTVFWSSVVIGLLFFTILFVSSPWIAKFFEDSSIILLLKVSSLVLVIGPLSLVPRAMIIKRLQIRNIAAAEFLAKLFAGITAIVMAFYGYGVWSLVADLILNILVLTIVLMFVFRWRPRVFFSTRCFKELFGFSSKVIGYHIVSNINRNIDYLMVGKFLGTASLGIYTLAFNLSNYPKTKLTTIITRTSLPVYSSFQDDNKSIKDNYIKSTLFLSVIIFPVMAGLFVLAPEFITEIYGDKWTGAVVPFQILCLGGALYSLSSLKGPILQSKGRPGLELQLGILRLAMTVITLSVAIRSGVNGVAAAITTVLVLEFLISQYFTNDLIETSMLEYLSTLVPAVVSSVIMTVAVFMVKNNLLPHLGINHALYVLGLSVLTGCIVYAMVLAIIRKDIYDSMIRNVKRSLT